MYSATLILGDTSQTRHLIKQGDPMRVEFSDFPTAGHSFRFEDETMPWLTSKVDSVSYDEDDEAYYVHTQNSTYILEDLEEFDYEDNVVEFTLDDD